MPADRTIRVLIVEDHRMLADLMRAVLGDHDDIVVVGWARTVSEARAQVAGHRPDVVLMDFELPDGDGVAALQLVAQACSTDDIAKRLSVGTHTVRNHIQAVLDRLDASSKLAAVTVARRDGVLPR